MSTIIDRCPWCEQTIAEPVDSAIENADAFCPHCDQPLFWLTMLSELPTGQPQGGPATATYAWMDDPSRRLPGLAGVESAAAVDCWQCGEPNQQVATTCHRCGAEIPPPATDVDDEPTVGSCAAPSGEPARRRIDIPAWMLVVLGVVLVALIVVLVLAF